MIDDARFFEHTHNELDGTALIRRSCFVSYSLPGINSETSTNYGVIFIAPRNCVVKDFYEIHSVAASDVGAVTLQLERLQESEALDAGDSLLESAINLKGAANTYSRGTLVQGYDVSLKRGDRLALKDSGALTDLEGVCVTIVIEYDYA